MRGGLVVLSLSMLSLAACEKEFDEKYQENLEQLNEEAKEIKSGVDQRLAEGQEADRIMETEAEEARNGRD
jgi:demethoxyubiquinone hydroxylase (CLK1/Coq7/Cat5 family)